MVQNNKQFLFTNEALYERNISDRIWPMFLEAQIERNLKDAYTAVKCYYLFTQQWYQLKSKGIKEKLDKIELTSKAASIQEATTNAKKQQLSWNQLEQIWREISNELENNGLFKKNFTTNPNQLALPTR